MARPLSRDEHYRRLTAHRDEKAYKEASTYDQLDDFFDTLVGRRWQITEEVYDESLNLMPPIYVQGGFLIREPLFRDIYSKFSTGTGGSFWHEYVAFPPRKSANELHAAAQKADEAFQAALTETFGKEAGDVRYMADRQPPAIRQLGETYLRATERWNEAVARERRRQPKGLEP